ncbi:MULTISPECIES: HrpT family type III secretion system protein [Pseudomonas]|uniref:HrpT family type III secretion system protein n=1 Tax=Pseudomonas TaxID=286 RepID=UPI001BE52BFE|nr:MULTISPECIES: HrpT family type III secretion system protein [Pseudomonas]MBT2340242.1 type III secretion protein [Pseudomonas fluorescens]MCD4530250.1 type III secretion protein [Pseudomonas sp. C3-2018]
MSRTPLLLAVLLSLPVFAGCASRSGCQAGSCERVEPDNARIVVWWSPGMRGGLGSPEHPLDYTVVPLED